MDSPQRITTFCPYPSGTVTASLVFGSTGVKRNPFAGLPPGAPAPDAPEDDSAATAAPPGPPEAPAAPEAAATPTTAPARNTDRRDMARATMSPRYSLPLLLGAE